MKINQVSFEYEKKKMGGFIYVPSGKSPFPAVILVHGFGGGAHEAKNKFMCEQLAQSGIIAFMFDFYDKPNGLSAIPIENTNVSLQLKILKQAVDFIAKQKEVDSTRIGLTGHSLGGMTAILYTPTDKRIKALVIQSAVSDFGKTKSTAFDYHHKWKQIGFQEFEKKWGKMRINWEFIEDGLKHDVDSALEKIKCPVLIFHGDKDESVSVEQAREQIKHLKKSDKLVIIKGADHCYKINNTLPEATKLLVDFMKEKL